MSRSMKIGIVGYGNLRKGVVAALDKCEDMELVGVFTRRAPESLRADSADVKVFHISEVESFQNEIDVMILCGGSATDLPEQGPQMAKMFNTVDSYDNHGKIPEYFEAVDEQAKESGKVGIISVGWDPGLFSINRLMAEAILPHGENYTFWGKGVSQGHSDAVRRVKGVKGAVQYTIPNEDAMNRVRSGENPQLETAEKHVRVCYVVAEDGYDEQEITKSIVTMPNYFADYDTEVHFITEEQLRAEHSKLPHGGFVIRSGVTGAEGHNQIIEYSLKLESNPEFTSSVLVAYARAAYRMNATGLTGAQTVFDVPPAYLSPKSPHQLRKELL